MAASNLVQRVLTGVVAAPRVLGAAWVGGWLWAALVAAAALVAQRELYALAAKSGAAPMAALGLGLGALAALRAVLPWALPALAAGVVVLVLVPLFRKSRTPLLDAATTLFGVAYPALLLGFAVDLRQAEAPLLEPGAGFGFVAATMLGVWGADSLAYFVGRAFGRRPLFPRVSPKKTWEGAVGGALGALLLVAVAKLTFVPVWSWADVAVVALACGVASQFGDLAESLFKRAADVKDSGAFLPGHGGLLDRLDALTVAVPLVALYLDHVAGLY